MALSAKERKQRQLARDYQARRRMPDSTYPYLSQPYYAWVQSHQDDSEFVIPWELMGLEAPTFEDDRGPAAYSNHVLVDQEEHDEIFGSFEGSVGRAELMAELLIEAGHALARSVNDYKRQELQKRFADLEAEDLSDPERRKAALAEGARITRLLDELKKNVRSTVPQWIVKGI